jgi:hypothetical protein
MDKLTHFAALKAAARVAFGVVVLGGCTAAATEEEAVSTESEINKAPCPSKADAGAKPDAKPSCENVLASAFGDAGDDFSVSQEPPKAVSEDVKTCCHEKLTDQSEASWMFQHRWACCNVLGSWNSEDRSVAMACTPWGPPVPPSMKRRASSLSTLGVA